MPESSGVTRSQSPAGSTGGSMSRSANGPTRTPSPLARRDVTRAAAKRASLRRNSRAFTIRNPWSEGRSPLGHLVHDDRLAAEQRVAGPAPKVPTGEGRVGRAAGQEGGGDGPAALGVDDRQVRRLPGSHRPPLTP